MGGCSNFVERGWDGMGWDGARLCEMVGGGVDKKGGSRSGWVEWVVSSR